MKFNQYPTVTTALTNGIVLIYQSAKVNVISFANLLKNYYTKAEVNILIANVIAGNSLVTTKIMDNLSIAAGTQTYTHNLDTLDFDYSYLEWNTDAGKYIKPQTPLMETGRTATTLTLYSSEAVPKFKLMFKTFV